jgi:hypothetical protein
MWLDVRTLPPTEEEAHMAKMTDEHKAALARGRREAAAVRRYLEALEQDAGGVDVDKLRKRVDDLQRRAEEETDPLRRVELIEQRIDAEKALEDAEKAPDMDALETEFSEVVVAYSQRKGISYKAWRELGVPASVLREGGLSRAS